MKKFLLTLCAAVAMATTASAQLAEKIAGQYAGDLYISLGEEITNYQPRKDYGISKRTFFKATG